ncbi:ribosomal protein L6, alpha-beta domain-containing protein [Gloeopeniophorella convolvens]|nr:ribosomal protein L6, alpha-beta domain-containing protein [Gloeopeniophorella convolvens]
MIPHTSRSAAAAALRAFSTSAVARGHTSNIGKAPIKFEPSVSFNASPTALAVTGPLGTTSVPLEPYMTVGFPAPDTLTLAVADAELKKQRSMWGLTRTLIQNAVTGMTQGFTTPLYLVGVGYRAALEDDPRAKEEGRTGVRLNMKLGYSHAVVVPVPAHIKAEVPVPTKIVLSCTDKHQLGLFAAKVRKWRPPEPYKGKGIFVGSETIRIKAVKKK